MQVSDLSPKTSYISSRGKKIPRYLYHMTSKKNYESMLKDGFIKTGHDAYLDSNLDGIFMFDLKNFIKRWCTTGIVIDDLAITLAKALFIKLSMVTSDIVVLKIPTQKLSLEKLRCRTQDTSAKVGEKHIIDGDTAKNQKHYTRKKQPIEYIFQQPIPISNVEIAGGAKIESIMDGDSDFRSKDIDTSQILKEVFNGKPEEKGVKLMSKKPLKFREIPLL